MDGESTNTIWIKAKNSEKSSSTWGTIKTLVLGQLGKNLERDRAGLILNIKQTNAKEIKGLNENQEIIK